MKFLNHQTGFTLMELMISIAIVGILTTIAIPSYIHYTRKAYYSEIVHAATPYKVAITECFHITGSFENCNGGTHSIPPDITVLTGNIASLTVQNGIISIVPAAKNGISTTDTYILAPALSNNMITWSVSGGGVEKGYVRKP